MCTALVVREDYWRGYFWREAEIRGKRVNQYQIERMVEWTKVDFGNIAESIRKVVDVYTQAMAEAFVILKDNFADLFEKLNTFICDLDLEPIDDFDVVCDKIEAKAIYLNRKESIRREQYYHNYFKLIKTNYNIQYHDRRC